MKNYEAAGVLSEKRRRSSPPCSEGNQAHSARLAPIRIDSGKSDENK
jgi:hypothetical protein